MLRPDNTKIYDQSFSKHKERLAASFSLGKKAGSGGERRSAGIGLKGILLNVKHLTKIPASWGRERIWLFLSIHGMAFN